MATKSNMLVTCPPQSIHKTWIDTQNSQSDNVPHTQRKRTPPVAHALVHTPGKIVVCVRVMAKWRKSFFIHVCMCMYEHVYVYACNHLFPCSLIPTRGNMRLNQDFVMIARKTMTQRHVVCIPACIYINFHAQARMHNMHTKMVHTYLHDRHTRAQKYAYIHPYIHICTHIHTHTHIHTYKHI